MPPITALLHTENDALRLGRCLETLYPCDEILVVDHGSRDLTIRVACEYGAKVLTAEQGASPDTYLQSAYLQSVRPGWVLCLDPRESLTEGLAASLFEWKLLPSGSLSAAAFSVFLRQETADGWVDIPAPQVRLVPSSWKRWERTFPAPDPSAWALEGELLHFVLP
ncbi:MAG TPA: hypothetical protein VKA07_03850 [Candidatus Sulfotelmatobacter sp.]|nr:hypothetical protein [Candidatus Sulfotelmatobacter sp.]